METVAVRTTNGTRTTQKCHAYVKSKQMVARVGGGEREDMKFTAEQMKIKSHSHSMALPTAENIILGAAIGYISRM